jgi:hypothetical protein
VLRKIIAFVLLGTVPSWATVTFTRAGGTQDAGSTPTVQVTVPAGGHAVGSLVALCLATSNDPGTTTVDDNASGAGTTNTWTIDRNFFDAGNTAGIIVAHSVLTKAMNAGDLISVHPTNQTDSNLYTAEFAASGGFVSTADTSNQNSNGFGLAWLTGSVTPTASASIVMIQCATSDSNTTSSTTSTSVEDYDHNGATAGRGLVVQHHIVASATGSYSEGGTWAANNDGPAAVAVFRESAGGSTCPKTRTLLGVGC